LPPSHPASINTATIIAIVRTSVAPRLKWSKVYHRKSLQVVTWPI